MCACAQSQYAPVGVCRAPRGSPFCRFRAERFWRQGGAAFGSASPQRRFAPRAVRFALRFGLWRQPPFGRGRFLPLRASRSATSLPLVAASASRALAGSARGGYALRAPTPTAPPLRASPLPSPGRKRPCPSPSRSALRASLRRRGFCLGVASYSCAFPSIKASR